MMKTVFKNNHVIHREADVPLIGFSNDKDGGLIVDFVNLDGYTIVPNEQYQEMKDKFKLDA